MTFLEVIAAAHAVAFAGFAWYAVRTLHAIQDDVRTFTVLEARHDSRAFYYLKTIRKEVNHLSTFVNAGTVRALVSIINRLLATNATDRATIDGLRAEYNTLAANTADLRDPALAELVQETLDAAAAALPQPVPVPTPEPTPEPEPEPAPPVDAPVDIEPTPEPAPPTED